MKSVPIFLSCVPVFLSFLVFIRLPSPPANQWQTLFLGLVSLSGYLATMIFIPRMMPLCVKANLFGYDLNKHPLGRYETGGRAALPIWLAYMTRALQGRNQPEFDPPAGLDIVRRRVDTSLVPTAIIQRLLSERVCSMHMYSRMSP